MRTHNTLRLILASVVALVLITPTRAQDAWPSRPVRLVVGFSVGGLSDVMARAIAARMSQSIGQQVFVENRTGAGSTIAGDFVAKSAPDGYTVWLQDMTNHAINASLYSKLPFDPLRDFTPVSMIGISPLMLVMHPSTAPGKVSELIDLVRAQPGKHSYASAGAGTANHLAAEMLKAASNLDVQHVPYKGSVPSVQAMLANETLFSFVTLPAALPHVSTGKLRALAVTSAKRVGAAPDTPTMIESGAKVEIASVSGILMPAKVPAAIVARVRDEFGKALAADDVKTVFQRIGAEPALTTPEETAAQMASDIARFAPLVKASGARAD